MLNRFHFKLTLLGLSLCLGVVSPVLGDVLEMKNGDRLSGEVLKFEKGILSLKTDYAQRIEVRSEAIAAIHVDRPVELQLKGGARLQGALTGQGESLQLSANEQVKVPWTAVSTFTIAPSEVIWSGNLYGGATHQTGNVDLLRVNFGGDMLRKSRARRLGFSFLYNYAEENSSSTSRDVYGALRYDRFVSRWFFSYLHAEVFRDTYRDLNLRVIAGPGFGYQFMEDDRSSLSLGAGLSWVFEDRFRERDRQGVRARLGGEFRQQLLEGLHFAENFAFYPSSVRSRGHALRNEASLISRIYGPWSLRLTNLYEREQDPSEGVSRDDVKSSLNLQYSF